MTAGVWPLVSLRSFEAVTGPKGEGWLVKTVGALIAAIGSALLLSSRRAEPSPEARWLAVSSAAALDAVDLRFGLTRRISPVYLLDAGIEAALVAAWLVLFQQRSEEPSHA